jgi:hypothetical protein
MVLVALVVMVVLAATMVLLTVDHLVKVLAVFTEAAVVLTKTILSHTAAVVLRGQLELFGVMVEHTLVH